MNQIEGQRRQNTFDYINDAKITDGDEIIYIRPGL